MDAPQPREVSLDAVPLSPNKSMRRAKPGFTRWRYVSVWLRAKVYGTMGQQPGVKRLCPPRKKTLRA